MVRVVRLLAVAAAVYVAAGLTGASAQTVYVINAPPGSPVELVMNASVVASATVDAGGTVALIADRPAPPAAMEAFIWMDDCGDRRRVLIVDRNAVPPPAGACARTQLDGLYRIQPVSSLVIQMGGSTPTLRLRQGEVPESWLAGSVADALPPVRRVPEGLILFGGGGLGSFREFIVLTCGAVASCSGDQSPRLLTGGVSFWFHRFFAAEASYARPGLLTTEGSGDDFRFASDLEGGLVAVSGKGGVPLGSWRFFGSGGVNYHQATLSTTQTVDDRVITVGDGQQTLPGGTQAFQSRVGGWGWGFGGGAEFWLSRTFGIYGEGGRVRVKGEDDGSETRIDDTMNFVVVGVRVRIPGS
jgi:hypothetical protein